ncbi:neuropeptide Y receptor type 6-like [Dendronephthya gigantea]|uniref:neuropeptide Y receptor type 6-like n=1 Tax=Dendronephthya gigantea TaxID=151771 RepID=UPI00106C9DFF|nr:neuropeptide Y receptor type 6-like [Dendronephthya gigantea]XP_028394657.1 neuropeptide Y receptor type 6-like [Dendronephthya gigantea]
MMHYYNQYTAVTWVVVPCYILTIIIGLFGNAVILRAYFTDASIQKQAYHLLLANGAFTDLVMCCVFTLLLLIYRANEHAHTIELSPLCELSVFISTLCISIQYIVFPLLSINRHDIACRPLSPWLTHEHCKKILFGAWSACAVVSFIQAGIVNLPTDSPKLYRCILVSRNLDPFTGVFFVYSVLLYCASIFVTVRSYIHMYRRVSAVESLHIILTEDDIGRTKICVVVAIVYTVFWTPFLLVQVYGIIGNYTEVVFNLHALSSILGLMASAVSPYLYCSMDKYYRKRFLEMFWCTQDDEVQS